MRSKRSPDSGCSQSPARNSTLARPSVAALPRATSSACALRSLATTCACGRSWAMASAIAPLPVPRSAMRHAACCGMRASASSTSRSVSGRGISVSGVTARSKRQKLRRPIRYATGSPAARRATSPSNLAAASGDIGASPCAYSQVRVRPSTSASSSPASSASIRAACLLQGQVDGMVLVDGSHLAIAVSHRRDVRRRATAHRSTPGIICRRNRSGWPALRLACRGAQADAFTACLSARGPPSTSFMRSAKAACSALHRQHCTFPRHKAGPGARRRGPACPRAR